MPAVTHLYREKKEIMVPIAMAGAYGIFRASGLFKAMSG
jgi:hypothetical protein